MFRKARPASCTSAGGSGRATASTTAGRESRDPPTATRERCNPRERTCNERKQNYKTY